MKGDAEALTIGGFARATGVHVETIRFYQQKGLLPAPQRPQGTIRRYGTADVARLRFVKAAQRLGFSLDEIGQLLSLEDGTHCDAARVLAEHKLCDVRERLAALRRIEAALAGLVDDCCAAATQAGSAGAVSCPLIASLQDR